MSLKEKREHVKLDFQTFDGTSGKKYLVFQTLDGSFHTFVEVEAKEAARDCGSQELANTREMWKSLWKN